MNSNITEPYLHGSSQLSIRFNDLSQMKEIQNKIQKLIPQKLKNQINFKIDGNIRRPPMIRTEKVESLWKIVNSIGRRLDINLREEHRWSSADICFADADKHLIDGLGAVGAKPEKKNEFILRHSILERSALLASLLIELNGKEL